MGLHRPPDPTSVLPFQVNQYQRSLDSSQIAGAGVAVRDLAGQVAVALDKVGHKFNAAWDEKRWRAPAAMVFGADLNRADGALNQISKFLYRLAQDLEILRLAAMQREAEEAAAEKRLDQESKG